MIIKCSNSKLLKNDFDERNGIVVIYNNNISGSSIYIRLDNKEFKVFNHYNCNAGSNRKQYENLIHNFIEEKKINVIKLKRNEAKILYENQRSTVYIKTN